MIELLQTYNKIVEGKNLINKDDLQSYATREDHGLSVKLVYCPV